MEEYYMIGYLEWVALKCHFIHAVYVQGQSTYNYDERQSSILDQIIVFGEDYIVLLVWIP
jgi:hypothetical protein